jgi:hypothetical protein
VVSIDDLAQEIHEWANDVFPDRVVQDIFLKSVEELSEMIREPDSPYEMADMFILLLDLAKIQGFSIEEAVRGKMEINRNRKWKIDRQTRIMRHHE